MIRSTTLDQPGSTPDPLAWLVRWMAADSDRVLAAVVRQLTADLPELAGARDDPEERIREAVGAHLDALADGIGLRPDDDRVTVPAVIDPYTRALARHESVSLAVLLRSFEKVHAELWRQLVHALRDGPHRLRPAERAAVLEQASAHLFAYFQRVSMQTATAYTAERTLRARRAASRRVDVVAGLLAGTVEQSAAEQALGYGLNSVHVGYVAWATSPAHLDRLDTAVAAIATRLRPRQHLVIPAGERSVHGWFSVHGDGWRHVARSRSLPEGTAIAWGSPHEGIDGFRASHGDALEARRVGEATGRSGPVLYDDVAVTSLASRDLAAACAFVHRELGGLATEDRAAPRLLETLGIYLAELASPTRTARRLHVHPNTVVKRVERIEALLGRPVDPASLSLRVAVDLAGLVRAPAR